MFDWSAEIWRAVADGAPEGIVVCDARRADHPVVYANAAFVALSGYSLSALLGTNLRSLQGNDRDQESRQRLREAVSQASAARVLIRNYRPDGTAWWNEIVLQPLRSPDGTLTHFVGFHRDAGERLRLGAGHQGLPSWAREDRLTGLHSRAYFEELLQRDWLLAQRDSHEIGLTLFDVDHLNAYNETFDRAAGDACIRRIARVIAASYRRGGDLIARWDGGSFAVLTQGEAAARAAQYAEVVAQRIRDLLMHHPRAASGRYVTLSAGVASLVPPRELALETLLAACHSALARAKSRGRNVVISAEATDFKPPPAKAAAAG